jgi:hypothetical protein
MHLMAMGDQMMTGCLEPSTTQPQGYGLGAHQIAVVGMMGDPLQQLLHRGG